MPNNIIAVVNDLHFSEKMRGIANNLNVPVVFVNDETELFDQLTKSSPSFIIFDLDETRSNPLNMIEKLKKDSKYQKIKTIGFFPRVKTEIRDKALSVGCDDVMVRSDFRHDLIKIMKNTM